MRPGALKNTVQCEETQVDGRVLRKQTCVTPMGQCNGLTVQPHRGNLHCADADVFDHLVAQVEVGADSPLERQEAGHLAYAVQCRGGVSTVRGLQEGR